MFFLINFTCVPFFNSFLNLKKLRQNIKFFKLVPKLYITDLNKNLQWFGFL